MVCGLDKLLFRSDALWSGHAIVGQVIQTKWSSHWHCTMEEDCSQSLHVPLHSSVFAVFEPVCSVSLSPSDYGARPLHSTQDWQTMSAHSQHHKVEHTAAIDCLTSLCWLPTQLLCLVLCFHLFSLVREPNLTMECAILWWSLRLNRHWLGGRACCDSHNWHWLGGRAGCDTITTDTGWEAGLAVIVTTDTGWEAGLVSFTLWHVAL